MAYFRHNTTGDIFNQPMTQTEYEALGIKNAINPKIAGYTFIGASGGRVKTIDTILNDYEYFRVAPDVASSSQIRIKVPGREGVILRSDIVGGKLTQEGLDKI